MARITAGVATSHVPAIGAAFDQGRWQDETWKPVFDGYEWVKAWEKEEKPDVVILVYNDHASAMMLDVVPTFALGCAEEFSPADEGWGRGWIFPMRSRRHGNSCGLRCVMRRSWAAGMGRWGMLRCGWILAQVRALIS